jgi:hypothetical protein
MPEEELEQFGTLKKSPLSEEDLIEKAKEVFLNALDLEELRILKKDGLKATISITVRIPGSDAAVAANYTTPFFIAKRTYEVISVTERHEGAGTDTAPVTVMLKKVPSGTTPASGTDVLTAGIDLKATINTNQEGTITSIIANKRLTNGDALSLVTTGTLTAVSGVTETIELKPL